LRQAFKNLIGTFGCDDPVVDLYFLSSCDAIVGPPSSFSMWAASYGSCPLYWIFIIREMISRVSFKPLALVDQDECGERFYDYKSAKRGVQ